MERTLQILATIVVGLAVAVTLWACETLVYGEEGGPDHVAGAILELQPAHDETTATAMAAWFHEAGEEQGHDPLFLVAIAMKESSLTTTATGGVGEVGLMQVHGAAVQLRPEGCSRDLESPRCQVRTGAAWLALARRQCGPDRSDYLFAYGVGRCPRSHEEATKHRSVRRARAFYERIGGEW
jgi:hypothetical protein